MVGRAPEAVGVSGLQDRLRSAEISVRRSQEELMAAREFERAQMLALESGEGDRLELSGRIGRGAARAVGR